MIANNGFLEPEPVHVELKTAYHWHCENCAAVNFALPEKAELTEAQREEAYREFHEMEEWEELPEGWERFDMVWIPDFVTCSECGETFGTLDEVIP